MKVTTPEEIQFPLSMLRLGKKKLKKEQKRFWRVFLK